ncbi:hypothetical protein QTP88_012472 [Uroleucon formosanum]
MSIWTEKNRLTQEDGEEEEEEETDWKKTTLLFSDRHSSDIPWASGIATARHCKSRYRKQYYVPRSKAAWTAVLRRLSDAKRPPPLIVHVGYPRSGRGNGSGAYINILYHGLSPYTDHCGARTVVVAVAYSSRVSHGGGNEHGL